MRQIELLSPARDLPCGIAAVNSGADAVYIGGPGFGARANAGNSLDDIRALADYAHLFRVKIHVTLNTILTDAELEEARDLAFKLYEAGADALIIQDYGLLAGPLPPLEIHASTQQDSETPAKFQFLEKQGFSQAVLPREMSVSEIKRISESAGIRLEAFVHGALCAGISGRCYLSAALTGRSANRGECAQLCRVKQSLYRTDGTPLFRDRYLLSMKDLSQTDNLEELIDAGVSSFKIEGRLKDAGYVRNVTAWYRERLDEIFKRRPDLARSSFGRTQTSFTPDITKSFNRGFTEYNTHERKDTYINPMAPGFVGVPIGKLKSQQRNRLTFMLEPGVTLNNGDSLNYYNSREELCGFRVSRMLDRSTGEIFQEIPAISPGTVFYRNRDAVFDRILAAPESSVRKLKLTLTYEETERGATLTAKDETGFSGKAEAVLPNPSPAKDRELLEKNLREKLGRLGDSVYELTDLQTRLPHSWFMPQSFINQLRREALKDLEDKKRAARTVVNRDPPEDNPLPPEERELDFRANLHNCAARKFFVEHGGISPEPSFESKRPAEPAPVLVSKHCLHRFAGLCTERDHARRQKLYLELGGKYFEVSTNCRKCRMTLTGPLPRDMLPFTPVKRDK